MNAAKVVVVTGAAGKIGMELVQAFRKQGYAVCAIDQREPEIEVDAYIPSNLELVGRSETENLNLVSKILSAIGSMKLHGVIHNAAVQVLGEFSSLSMKQWHETFNVNLFAPVSVSQGLLPRLISDRGSIVHISSVHDVLTKRSFAAYSTSKAALSGLTRAMSLDLAPHVRVNAISPAAIETPMLMEGFRENEEAFRRLEQVHPMKRIGRGDEVASLALYLLSEESAFITGQTFYLTGGINSVLHDPLSDG